MKKKNLKLKGILLAGVIVIVSFAYAVNIQPIVFGNTLFDNYSGNLSNFESYRSFTDYLIGNYSLGPRLYYEPFDSGLIKFSGVAPVSLESHEGVVDYSQTNVQVTGVDEPDIVKTDGEYLYIVSNNKIIIVKATPAEDAEIIHEMVFNDSLYIQNIFISGNRLVVFTRGNYPIYKTPVVLEDVVNVTAESDMIIEAVPCPPSWYSSSETHIMIFDLDDITDPEMVKDVVVPGDYVSARLIGDFVYLITNQYSYDIIRPLENETIVPSIIVNGVIKEVPITDISYIVLPERGNSITNIVSVNVHDDDDDVKAKIYLLGNSELIYVSTNNIYIIYTTNEYYNSELLEEIIDELLMPTLPESFIAELELVETLSIEDYQKETVKQWILQNYTSSMDENEKYNLALEICKRLQKTTIHRITIEDGNIAYQAEGEIPGYVSDQFQLSEHNGHLRVSSTLNGWRVRDYFPSLGDQNSIYVLDMDLHIVGRLEGLAPDESIYATRFIGDTCYLVTFRQIDPFFVIDLSNPSEPKILGELKIPGYSTYLHPYDETHIIGIGMDGGRIKISLFDVSNMSSPVELARYDITDDDTYWGDSEALYEHKAFLFDKEKNLLVIPAGSYMKQSAYVFNISTKGIEFKGKITHNSTSGEKEELEYDYYYWNYGYGDSIKRTLYIDDVLYTISDNMVKMNSLEDLSELNSIELV